jgi:hypothetical protein
LITSTSICGTSAEIGLLFCAPFFGFFCSRRL